MDAPWLWQDIQFLVEHLQTIYRHYDHRHLYLRIYFTLEGPSTLYSTAYQHLHHLLYFLLPHAIYTIDFNYREHSNHQYKIVAFHTTRDSHLHPDFFF